MNGSRLGGSHRRRGQRRGTGPGRLAAAALVLLGLMVLPGTYASWTAQGTLGSATFTSGTLDVRLAGDDGNPVAWSNSALGLSGMLPGESVAADFPVQNVGNVPLRYTASVAGSGGLAGYLTVEAYIGGAASNGTTGGLRTSSCSGTGQGSTSPPGAVVGTPQEIAAGAAQQLCLRVGLDPAAPGSVQGAPGTLTISFLATQVGAP